MSAAVGPGGLCIQAGLRGLETLSGGSLSGVLSRDGGREEPMMVSAAQLHCTYRVRAHRACPAAWGPHY